MDTAEDRLSEAIVADDLRGVASLLQQHAGLVRSRFGTERLHEAGIYHWIYVGDTFLHLAAAGYRVRIVEALLAAGADPHAAFNRRRATPLHYAADGFITGPAWDAAAQVATLDALLGAGAGIDAQDQNGATALHRAVRTRCAAAVGRLLAAGADPRLPNKSGSTPFHLAVQTTGRGGSGEPVAREAQRQIIECLLAQGVSPGLRDSHGRTVVECAQGSWVKDLFAAR